MKRFFTTLTLAALLLLTAACSRQRIISDDDLAMIFRDAFLANAYVSTQNVAVDSLNIYEPIFANYGYTSDDVQYTIGNFSKRKSARLGDIVERAIKMLETEGAYYDKQIAVLDTINNVAGRAFTRTVRADSLIRVRNLKDTTRLHIVLDKLRVGEYNVHLSYLVDSLDRNNRLTAAMWLERADHSRMLLYNFTLLRNREETFTRKMAVDTSARRLVIDLINFDQKPRQPSITVRNFAITYTPPSQIAVDSLYLKQLDIRIFADEFFRAAQKDSL
ncbi:MAG: DUF4296 domain-containing protein [Alistipes sp.]